MKNAGTLLRQLGNYISSREGIKTIYNRGFESLLVFDVGASFVAALYGNTELMTAGGVLTGKNILFRYCIGPTILRKYSP